MKAMKMDQIGTNREGERKWERADWLSLYFLLTVLPDQMFHILVQACLTEKQFKFGFNRKAIVFVLCLTL